MKSFSSANRVVDGLASLSAWATYAAPASGERKADFSRVFKSSSPEFVQIAVREDSDAASYEIRQLDEACRVLRRSRWARGFAQRCSILRAN